MRDINAIYRRLGTLWESRFKSAVIDSEHYRVTCMRYIEMNPVRAGMVDDTRRVSLVELSGECLWGSL